MLTSAADTPVRFTSVGHAIARSLQKRRTQPATKTRKQPARFTNCQAALPHLLQWHLAVAQTSFAQLRQTPAVSSSLRIQHQQRCCAPHCYRHDQRHNAV